MNQRILFSLLLFLSVSPAFAQSKQDLGEGRQKVWNAEQVRRWLDFNSSQKYQNIYQNDCPDYTSRREAILNGNKITTEIFNFGSISSPGNSITDIVWNGLGYGYEFGPLVGAEIVDEGHQDPLSVPKRDQVGRVVRDAVGDTVWVMHVVSDGLVSNGGEISPDGSEWWGWQPIPCAQPVGSFEGLQVVEPTSDKIPTSDAKDTDLDGRPDSWPDDWYNDNLGEYVWPGALQQGASNADQEAIYFMNDYRNQEFEYYPFPSDSTRKGLGLEVEVRLYQWSNPLAEDAIFLIYKITNKSDKDLEKVIFGMWGDPHIGGPNNWQDDLAYFDAELNMVYAWDADGRSDVAGRLPGYFGYKFLESPGIGNEIIEGIFFAGDAFDNDNDGMIDESWTDGIDNDGDWDPERDDVGIDGVPGTGDEGEKDGLPTAGDLFDITKPGEPNFEFTDIDESDMIGLTSFVSPPFAGNRIDNDERVWSMIQPGRFDEVPAEPGDYVFLYGSGSFPLRAGETKRFSIALIVGESFEDLTLNARTVQQIYDVGYRFAKPPTKPVITAVPGDKKVTLYWDDRSERSFDPLTLEEDFEGYAIYRSTNHQFSDQQTITDINGTKFLYRPLTTPRGVEAKFDLKNGIEGPSPIVFPERGISYDLGDDTGLFHTFVDSNRVINGQTYYYALVAYDRGFEGDAGAGFGEGIPPTETAKTITYNPTTDSYIFDDNTVSVIPRPVVAGYVPPSIESTGGLLRESGYGTGDIRIEIVDEMAVTDGNPYIIDFEEEDNEIVYSVIDDRPVDIDLLASPGKSISLRHHNIIVSSFQLTSSSGSVLQNGIDYELNEAAGSIKVLAGGTVSDGEMLKATFKYAPIADSNLLDAEEANLVFDGLHLFIQDDPLRVNMEETGWVQDNVPIAFNVTIATSGPGRIAQPFDYEIRFENSGVSTSISTNLPLPFTIVNLTRGNQAVDAFVPDINRDGAWNLTEPIIFIEIIDGAQTATWQVKLLDESGDTPLPAGGNIFYIQTDKPFSEADRLSFTTAAATTEADLVREELRDVYVVPNPYVATNEIEPRNPFVNTERGDRRLYFANVPQTCTIRIYTLAGELVDVIEHSSTLDDGKAFWDLRTKDNMNIAYGLYLFHVESIEGTFIGKFAVIK